GEETIAMARIHEANQVFAGARPHNCRPADDRNSTFRFAHVLQFATELADHGRLRFVGIDDGVDELKEIGARRRTLHRNNANTLMTDYDFIIFADVEKLYRSGGTFLSVNSNRAIHHRRPDFDLLAVKPNERLLVGCNIEIARENSVRGGPGQLRVRAFDNFGAVLPPSQNELVERFSCLGRDFHSREALVHAFFPDLDLANLEIRAVRQNLIEHLRQNKRIDNVTAQLDRFRKHLRSLTRSN